MLFHRRFLGWITSDARASFQNILRISSGVLTLTLLIGYINELVSIPILMSSFGASIFLVIAAPDVAFAQPKNVIFGHIISSSSGLISLNILGDSTMSMALAITFATMFMLLVKVSHPPAASNPIAIFFSTESWDFLWFTTVFGAVLVVCCALVFHRILKRN